MKVWFLFRRYWRELVLALFVLSPWVSLLVFGVLWLHDNHAMLPWLAGTAALGLVALPLRRIVRQRLRDRTRDQVRPNPCERIGAKSGGAFLIALQLQR